jgi:small-conductance mechanosensitive channel
VVSLETTLLGNSLQMWLSATFLALTLFIIMRVAKTVLIGRLAKLALRTKTGVDDLIVALLQKTSSIVLLALALYFASMLLILPAKVSGLITHLLIIVLLLQAGVWGDALIRHRLTDVVKRKAAEDASSIATITVLGFIGRLAVWSVVVLVGLDNLGFNVTTLIAGLGVGGVAVALATQNILGDLFASISIVLDKPFMVGDFIIVGDYLGTVEHIGIKTTRVRSLSGEQLVFSNNDLLGSRIRNYKRMSERRIVFSLGVVYQTPYEKLQAIPGIIRKIIEAQPHTRFDRAHFKSYGDFALIFEIVYYVGSPDYNVYMDQQQAINLAIFQRFEEEQIEFAYPTQTLHIEKG